MDLLKWPFGSKNVLGLDIGSTSIKLVELDGGGRSFSIKNLSVGPTPPNSIDLGEVVDMVSISEAIRSLVEQLGTKRRNVVIGLWGPSVLVKKISLPSIEKDMVQEQITWEAEQYIPWDIETVSLTYHPLGNKDRSNEVLIAAAKNQVVLQNIEAIESIGLSCSIVDLSSFALANCLEINYGTSNEVMAVLDIGAQISNLVVVKKGKVIFSRDIQAGGAQYTSAIHKQLGVTLKEAEALKISASQGREVPMEIHSLLSTTNMSVNEEIKGIFDFFHQTTEVRTSRIFMTGGGSSTPGLKEMIGQTLNIPYEVMDPFRKIRMKKGLFSDHQIDQLKQFCAVSVGLGLRKVGDK